LTGEWTVTAEVDETETPRTDAVAATPRKPPQLIRAVYHRPEEGIPTLQTESQIDMQGESLRRKVWVIVTFDRRMDLGIGDENRYVLRIEKRIDGVSPVSAIRDRMGTRALLVFDADSLVSHFGQSLTAKAELNIGDENRYVLRIMKRIGGVTPVSAIRDRMGTRALLVFDADSLLSHFGQPLTAKTDPYEITVSNVTDIDDNPIRASTQPLEIPLSVAEATISDLRQARVYPNPVRPNSVDKGAITFDRLPVGTRIQLFDARGELLETLNVTDQDRNRKEWWLTSNNTADVSSGIYIYVLEFDALKKVGKIAVIK
jgi:hypothetical protein